MIPSEGQYEVLILNKKTPPTPKNNKSKTSMPMSFYTAQEVPDLYYRKVLQSFYPGDFPTTESANGLELMQLRESEHVISIEMAGDLRRLDFSKSIDPFFFMELQEYN